MMPEAAILRQLIRFNAPVAPLMIPALFVIYWIYPATVVLILALSIVPTVIVQQFAARFADRQEVSVGITALAVSIWIPTLTMAIFAPDLWPITIIFSVLSVVIALPFVDGRHLLFLVVGASMILVVGAVATMFDPMLTLDELPDTLVSVSAALAALTGSLLCMFSIRQSNGRLRSTLDEARRVNGALRDTERLLERKVADRTTEASDARDVAVLASRAKSDFLANMSHELRTPLNAIIGYGEILQEETVENDHGEYLPDLDRIVASGRHLLGLINEVLDLSKVEAGKMDLNIDEFDLEPFTRGLEDTITPLVQKNSNRFEIQFNSQLGVMRSDEVKVRQVLFNMLSNATKFTKEGTITLQAERQPGATGTGDWIRFVVRDTGIGMTAEQVTRVFRAFGQADRNTAREYGGTGLGLTISQNFCELLGGSIDCESEPGVGTEFIVMLPAEAPAAVDQTPVSSVSEDLSEGTNVLVVDDDPSARDVLSRFLRREGFAVRTAGSGLDALSAARESKPDVITLDVVMPEMDGWEVLRELKDDPELSSVPVILLTVSDDDSLGYALGAAAYLNKPFDWESLSSALGRLGLPGRGTALVVDDDPAARDIATRSLKKAGWDVRQAENGRQALAAVTERTPSLIILDLMMPEMDGFEFVAALHERPEWRTIRTIVVTSLDVTPAERARLGDAVGPILQKGNYTMSDLVAEILRVVPAEREQV